MNTSGCRSSSVSTMSPNGVLWTASTTAAACPTALLPIARACSSATGLRFCGMMLLHCTNPSGRRRYPNSLVHQSSRSWTTRPRPDEQHRGRRDALEQIVDGGDAAVGVAGRAVEAEQRRRPIAIDRKAGAGDRAGAERVLVGAGIGGPQPGGVALELLDHRQQVVRDRRRLRRLGVRVRRKDVVAVARREVEQHVAQPERPVGQRQHQLALPHPVHRHVDVVARARGVQPAGRVLAAAAARSADRRRRTGPRRCRRSAPGAPRRDRWRRARRGWRAARRRRDDAAARRASRDARSGSPSAARGTAPSRPRSCRSGPQAT